jgi:hypothetical protein
MQKLEIIFPKAEETQGRFFCMSERYKIYSRCQGKVSLCSRCNPIQNLSKRKLLYRVLVHNRSERFLLNGKVAYEKKLLKRGLGDDIRRARHGTV